MIEVDERKSEAKVTLLGAGPGALDLITVRGVKALSRADVVLYDALVDTRMLEHCPDAIKIFVGKRMGYKRYSQEEINDLLVRYAFGYGNVVRLKGGDPFVFGRGMEEVSYVDSFGIDTEIIPGITSAIAVPSSAGISVTHRTVARGFWVLTGTNSDGRLNEDLTLAAKSSATVVILMGMSKLEEIKEVFFAAGKEEIPVAIIQNGTTHKENVGVARMNSISEVVDKKELSSPAIIVVGEVVRSNPQHAQLFSELVSSVKKAS